MRFRIFEKFQRGEGTRIPGLGLGLSIVRGLVDCLGGTVQARSPRRWPFGRGVSDCAFRAGPVAGEFRDRAMSTVLVIDDEPQIRRLLAVLLEGSDYDVVEASSGKEGLVQAATRLPDAVILDLGLPDISGVEVLRRLREWTQMPVLILSVMDAEQDKVLALDAGADDYVTKPFHGEEVLARLRAIMRRGAAPNDPVAEAGPLRMDFAARLAWLEARWSSSPARSIPCCGCSFRTLDKIVTR